jgi:hypothetical protein
MDKKSLTVIIFSYSSNVLGLIFVNCCVCVTVATRLSVTCYPASSKNHPVDFRQSFKHKHHSAIMSNAKSPKSNGSGRLYPV